MLKKLKASVAYINFPRFLPIILFVYLSNNKTLVRDTLYWAGIFSLRKKYNFKFLGCLLFLLTYHKEFRSLVYYRLPILKLFKILAMPQENLYIHSPKIGKCLFIQHGFATIISAKSIGDYCWINQQVTIGFSDKCNAPIIGNNVKIHAGAIVIGGITIGDNVIIGAGSTVVKSVPQNTTVVGFSAKPINR